MLQSADAPVVGVASLPLPHAQQVAIVAVDSQGYLHLYTTPLADNVVVWDPSRDGPAEGLHAAAPQGTAGSTAPAASSGGALEQDQEAAVPAAETGSSLQSLSSWFIVKASLGIVIELSMWYWFCMSNYYLCKHHWQHDKIILSSTTGATCKYKGGIRANSTTAL